MLAKIALLSVGAEVERFTETQAERKHRLRILFVEDEQIIRDALVPLLFAADFDCREAADGRAAVDLLASGTRIDLVLSNVLLPIIDGVTLFVHARRRYPRIPFVFMTAIDDVAVRLAAMREGAAGYLLKPFDSAEFLGMIRAVLGKGPPSSLRR